MSNDSTPDLERLVGGEQDGLPPAPAGAADRPDEPSPEERFVAPDAGDLDVESVEADAEASDSTE